MTDHILVLEFDEDLIRRFSHKAMVIKTTDANAIHHINNVVNETNKLHCVFLQQPGKLAYFQVREDWKNIPVHLFIPEFGLFRDFISKAAIFRELNMRIFLSTDFRESFEGLQLMASLGIDCGLYFGNQPIDWDMVNDLMHYSVYGKYHRASIEPFRYLTENYIVDQHTDFGSVYFENPERYLHINKEGKVAAGSQELTEGQFIAEINELQNIRQKPEYKARIKQWQQHFIKADTCSKCPAWRVCLGKFEWSLSENPGCQQFFSDVIDACDFKRKSKNQFKTKELCHL